MITPRQVQAPGLVVGRGSAQELPLQNRRQVGREDRNDPRPQQVLQCEQISRDLVECAQPSRGPVADVDHPGGQSRPAARPPDMRFQDRFDAQRVAGRRGIRAGCRQVLDGARRRDAKPGNGAQPVDQHFGDADVDRRIRRSGIHRLQGQDRERAGQRRAVIRRGLGDEPETAAGDRGDMARLAARVAQQSPQRRDRLVQVVFPDDETRPADCHQLGLRDHAAAVLQQAGKDIEGPARKRQRPAIRAKNLASLQVDVKPADAVAHRGGWLRAPDRFDFFQVRHSQAGLRHHWIAEAPHPARRLREAGIQNVS